MGLVQYFWRGLEKIEGNRVILSQCVKPRERENDRGSPTVDKALKEGDAWTSPC